ncbi:MAG: hypothetical protein AAGG57_19170 [Pseudomonadota bacterium]
MLSLASLGLSQASMAAATDASAEHLVDTLEAILADATSVTEAAQQGENLGFEHISEPSDQFVEMQVPDSDIYLVAEGSGHSDASLLTIVVTKYNAPADCAATVRSLVSKKLETDVWVSEQIDGWSTYEVSFGNRPIANTRFEVGFYTDQKACLAQATLVVP